MKRPDCMDTLRANGKSIYENIGHGQKCTYIRVDSRGKFVPGHDEKMAAYIAHACNLYPELVEALRDPCMMPALEAWAKGCNANAVRCLENARAALAKCEGE